MFDTDVCGTCGGTFELEQMRAFLPPCWYCAKCVSEMDICNFCHQGYPKDSADTPPNQRWWADSEHTLCKVCLKLELLALKAERIAELEALKSLKWAAKRLVDDVRTQLIKDDFEANIQQKLF